MQTFTEWLNDYYGFRTDFPEYGSWIVVSIDFPIRPGETYEQRNRRGRVFDTLCDAIHEELQKDAARSGQDKSWRTVSAFSDTGGAYLVLLVHPEAQSELAAS